jgi:hypothetical protein
MRTLIDIGAAGDWGALESSEFRWYRREHLETQVENSAECVPGQRLVLISLRSARLITSSPLVRVQQAGSNWRPESRTGVRRIAGSTWHIAT